MSLPDHAWTRVDNYFLLSGQELQPGLPPNDMVHWDMKTNEVHLVSECTAECP